MIPSPDELRIERFADMGLEADAPFFAELQKRREHAESEQYFRERRLEADVHRAIQTVIQDLIPVVECEADTLIDSELSLDSQVRHATALERVRQHIQENIAAGYLPPPRSMQRKWYYAELTAIHEEESLGIIQDRYQSAERQGE